jgi:apolipoprotein N-acyltransferase
MLTAVAAYGTCLMGGLLALGFAWLLPGPQHLMSRVLAGIAARAGVPLIVCLLVALQGEALVDAGFAYYLLAFYFVTLVVETFLLVGQIPPQVTEKLTV